MENGERGMGNRERGRRNGEAGRRGWPAIVAVVVLAGQAFLVVPGEAQIRADSAGTVEEKPAPPREKDPRLAGAFSIFVPGLGHMYAGETLKGGVLSGLFIGSIVAVIGADIGKTNASITPGAWGAITLLGGVYLYSLIDSPYAAHRANATPADAHLLRFPDDGIAAMPGARTKHTLDSLNIDGENNSPRSRR